MTENTRPLRDFFQSLPQGTPSYLVGADLTVIPLSSIGGGIVVSIVPGNGVDVDSSSAANPVVSLNSSSIASLSLADTSLQPGSVTISDIVATGTPSSATYLRGDGTWSTPSGGGGGGGQVDSIGAGDGIDVDDTDPVNPIVGLDTASVASLALADTAVQPARSVTAGTGLTGGGDLSTNRTISLSSGTISSLALADTSVQPSRSITANNGLTGGGDLSANRTVTIDKATAANIRAGASNKVVTADALEAALAPVVSATVTGTVARDWSDYCVRDDTVTGNVTYSNPTNVEPGTSREVWIFGDSATERSISWGTNFKGALPDVTVTSTRGLHVVMSARTSTFISLSWKPIEI
jgi:hypothetical protein